MKKALDKDKNLGVGSDHNEFIGPKLFRESENKKKLAFILGNSDITDSIVVKSQQLSNINPYHNFGHQLGVAESAIRIAQAQGLAREDINLLVLVALFHDASHTGTTHPDDEEKAYEDAIHILTPEELEQLGCCSDDIKKLILATKFSMRGKCEGVLEKIIQDADMGTLGYGPYYMLYSTIGLIDEEHIAIQDYITEENKFISFLESICSDIYLSEGAKKIFTDPRKNMTFIAQWPKEVLSYAYQVRYDDISFSDFVKHIDIIIARQ